MNITYLYLLFVVFLLSCNDSVQQNAGNEKKQNTSLETLLKTGEIQPYSISSFETIGDSIRLYTQKIDLLIDKNIRRLQYAPKTDTLVEKLMNKLIAYKESYKNTIENSSEATLIAVGLNHQNHNSKLKFEYFSVLIEYLKIKYIASEICTTFFESGLIKEEPGSDGITPCLLD